MSIWLCTLNTNFIYIYIYIQNESQYIRFLCFIKVQAIALSYHNGVAGRQQNDRVRQIIHVCLSIE